MAKRIYSESVKKWAKRIGIPAGSVGCVLFLYILYTISIGAMVVTGYSGDIVCAGTEEDPCYAYINFTVNEDVFWYPIDYDPWGRNESFSFNPAVKSWILQRSWGSGWRTIPMNKSCTGTWCGAPPNTNVTYSVVWRKGMNYRIRIVGYKNVPFEDIKWGFGNIDPVWKGVNITYELISNTGTCLVNCNLRFKFKISKNYTITDLNKFKPIFKKTAKAKNLTSWGYRIMTTEKYNETRWVQNITCNPYNDTYPNGTIFTRPNCTDSPYQTMEEKTRYEWRDFNPLGKTIKADRWYYIELWGKKELSMGDNNIDAVPTIGNYELPFAWWNSSYGYRYPINCNASTLNQPVVVNATEGVNGHVIWTQNASEKIYLYCEASGCTSGESAVANETDEKCWENTTSRDGNCVTDIWVDTVLAMHFDEGAGTTAYDSSPYRNNGTLGAGVSWNTSGHIGSAVKFATGATNNVSIPDDDSLTPILGEGWVIEAWTRMDSVTGHNNHILAVKGVDAFYEWRAMVYKSGAYYGRMMYGIRDDGGGANLIGSATTAKVIQEDVWQVEVYNYTGGTANADISMLVNGTQFPDADAGAGSYDAPYNGTYVVLLGNFDANWWFCGLISELFIWNRTLTTTEADEHFTRVFATLGAEEAYGDTTDPVVTLNAPADNNESINPVITFNCTAYDDINLTNVTLFHNYTAWHANETNHTGINDSHNIFIKNFPNTTLVWNCYACDNSSNCAFATANRTVAVNTVTGDTCDTCDIDCTENCTVDAALDCSNQQLNFTGSGTVTIEANITDYSNAILTGGCHVICRGGYCIV